MSRRDRLQELTKREADRVVDLYRDHHLSVAALSQRFGCSASVIRRILKSAGLEIVSGRYMVAGVAGNGRINLFGGRVGRRYPGSASG